ncbi:MAG: hypothetical protein H7249_14030 [Chitinophagaceae bacterium]|nr:hypothetical protein [Oligoflexus sp.]
MGAKKFSPAEKAAIIVASLGEELAPQVFGQLQKEDAGKIGRSMQTLGRLELTEIESVLNEFLTILQSPTIKTLDAKSFIDKMSKKIGKNGEPLIDSFGTADYTMRVFDMTKPDLLYRAITSEKPQTLALILSHAPSTFAAPLLKFFPEKMRIEILMRMAKLREVDPMLIQELDDHLIRELDKLGHGASQKIGGVKKVAEILNALNQDANGLLERISERNPLLATDIQQEMFTFEDILKINGKGIAEIVKGVKREVLLLALRGADVKLVAKFTSGMSERSASMLREDLEALGAQKKSDVMSARSQLLSVTRNLIEAGTVQIEGEDGQYV